MRLATEAGDRETAVTAYRELGFVEVQAGRRQTAEAWLARAEEAASSDVELAAVLARDLPHIRIVLTAYAQRSCDLVVSALTKA